MVIAGFLSASRVRCYETCAYQYRLRYVERLAMPPAPPLLLGTLLHRAVLDHVARPAADDREALRRLDGLVGATALPPGVDARRLFEDVAACLVAFRASDYAPGRDWRAEVTLRATIGPLVLLSRADAVSWQDGELVSDEFKLSAPPTPFLNLQTAFVHAGLRARHARAAIRHRLIAFRPTLVIRDVLLDEGTYRRVLRALLDVARRLGAEREWRASPGEACASCEFAEICPHALGAIDSAPF